MYYKMRSKRIYRSRKKNTRRNKNRRTYKKRSYRRTYKKGSYRKRKNLKRQSLKGGAVGIEATITIKQTFNDREPLKDGTIIGTKKFGRGRYKGFIGPNTHIIVFDTDWVDGEPPIGLAAGGSGGQTERRVTKNELVEGGRRVNIHPLPKVVQVFFEVTDNKLKITSEDMDDIKAFFSVAGLSLKFPKSIIDNPEVRNKNIMWIDSQLFARSDVVLNGTNLIVDLST